MPAESKRLLTNAVWLVPFLLALIVYWPGLICWFQKDDFAWLGLRDSIHNWHDLRWALFTPLSQGTIRTLSERVVYISLYEMFGMNALPYRIWSFMTCAAVLVMISKVAAKLFGSLAAGFWAALLWVLNSGVSVALCWTPVNYEQLCTLFFLVGLWLLIRYDETGERRFYVAQWVTFILGFGILELNVVYPAIAAAYAICRSRRLLPKILPMFVLSAIYSAIHFAVAPAATSGPYKMYWDASIFSTLWTFWKWGMGPTQLRLIGMPASPFRSGLTFALTLGLFGFVIWKLRRREWLAAFFPLWFLITIGPLLSLRDHMDFSYLTVPMAGVALWGAWAIVSAWHSGWPARGAAALLIVIYIGSNIPVGRATVVSFYDRSIKIRRLVEGVVAISRQQPGKMIVLKNLDTDMFWSAIYGRPFRLYGIYDVFVAPEDDHLIAPDAQMPDHSQFLADPAKVRVALEHGNALILDVGGPVRDVTAAYHEPL